MDRLESFGLVRSIDAESRRVQVVVSTGDVARDEMIIDQRGWVFDHYDRNPVVLWAHDDHALPIARAIPALRVRTDNELIETHEFATHPRAEEVWALVRDGFVNATSVRWNPISWQWEKRDGQEYLVFTRQELLESSYVSIPADPGALVMRAGGGALDTARYRPNPAAVAAPVKQILDPGRVAAAIRASNALLRGQ